MVVRVPRSLPYLTIATYTKFERRRARSSHGTESFGQAEGLDQCRLLANAAEDADRRRQVRVRGRQVLDGLPGARQVEALPVHRRRVRGGVWTSMVWTSIGVNYSTYKPTDQQILERYMLKWGS